MNDIFNNYLHYYYKANVSKCWDLSLEIVYKLIKKYGNKKIFKSFLKRIEKKDPTVLNDIQIWCYVEHSI